MTIDDVDEKIKPHVFSQDYSPATVIDGVKLIDLKTFPSEEGDFGELIRLNETGHLEVLPEFKLKQINRTRLNPGSIKAWHLHFKQDELWYLPPAYELLLGLWDIRADSHTNNATMRIMLGGGKSRLVFIPHGVAHGSVIFAPKPVELFYFVNQPFNIDDPDEKRIHWDALGAEFWQPLRD